MRIELFRVCDGQNQFNQKHRFNATESFKEVEICPICKRPMELVSIKVKSNGQMRQHDDDED